MRSALQEQSVYTLYIHNNNNFAFASKLLSVTLSNLNAIQLLIKAVITINGNICIYLYKNVGGSLEFSLILLLLMNTIFVHTLKIILKQCICTLYIPSSSLIQLLFKEISKINVKICIGWYTNDAVSLVFGFTLLMNPLYSLSMVYLTTLPTLNKQNTFITNTLLNLEYSIIIDILIIYQKLFESSAINMSYLSLIHVQILIDTSSKDLIIQYKVESISIYTLYSLLSINYLLTFQGLLSMDRLYLLLYLILLFVSYSIDLLLNYILLIGKLYLFVFILTNYRKYQLILNYQIISIKVMDVILNYTLINSKESLLLGNSYPHLLLFAIFELIAESSKYILIKNKVLIHKSIRVPSKYIPINSKESKDILINYALINYITTLSINKLYSMAILYYYFINFKIIQLFVILYFSFVLNIMESKSKDSKEGLLSISKLIDTLCSCSFSFLFLISKQFETNMDIDEVLLLSVSNSIGVFSKYISFNSKNLLFLIDKSYSLYGIYYVKIIVKLCYFIHCTMIKYQGTIKLLLIISIKLIHLLISLALLIIFIHKELIILNTVLRMSYNIDASIILTICIEFIKILSIMTLQSSDIFQYIQFVWDNLNVLYII